MKIEPTNNSPTFGILKNYKKTQYGEYFWGLFKNHKIEVYHVDKNNQRLIYVSDIYKNWIKSKLTYFENGVRKITKSAKRK